MYFGSVCKVKFEIIINLFYLFNIYFYFQINIFMTYMFNYGNDRLVLYIFESVFKFVQCWINLRLKQVLFLEMGIKYFEMYFEEKDFIWRVSFKKGNCKMNFFCIKIWNVLEFYI